jgi:hypothetical protein
MERRMSETQQLPTSGIVDSRLGKIELKNGYPTDAAAKKLFDEIDFQRACQSYLWALPLMAMQEWQREHRETFGAGNLDYVVTLPSPTSSASSPPTPRRPTSWGFPT